KPGCVWQSVLRRYSAVLEPALRRARHAQTEFPFDVPGTKARCIFLHHKSADAPVLILGPNNFHIRNRRVAYPTLAAVENVVVTVAFRARFHPAWIRAVSMFCERKTTDPLARDKSQQPARVLLGGTE